MLKFIALAVLAVFFFSTSDAAQANIRDAKGCPTPKAPSARIKCAIANGAVYRYDNRYGKCLWIYPNKRTMQFLDCAVPAKRG
jgi:hypothetical protein